MRTAAVDAEEEYWRLTIPRVRQLGENPDPVALAAHLEEWLLAEDWHGALRAMPATAPGEPFAITLAGHRKRFLAREPFIRPAQNNLYPAENITDDDHDEQGADDGQCPRCRISQQIGGILCVCGHDWDVTAAHRSAPSPVPTAPVRIEDPG